MWLALSSRALTTLFGNGAGAFRIGKNSVASTKIGKKYNVLLSFYCQTDITYMVLLYFQRNKSISRQNRL